MGEGRFSETSRPCIYCEGSGCEECDNTGQRVSTFLETDDGARAHITGSVPLNDEAKTALAAIVKAAVGKLDREGSGIVRRPKDPPTSEGNGSDA